MKISLFSGARGSVPGMVSSNRYLLANPRPPKKFFAVSSGISSSEIVPAVRFTRKIFPINPNISLPPLVTSRT